MKRRDFLKTGIVGVSTVFANSNALSWGWKENKPYTEYDRDVCYKLDGLVDYNTGEPFTQDKFVVAYFTTPYQKYQGCTTDALNIFQQKSFAEEMLGNKVEIEAVLVTSPLEEGDPYPGFANSYTDGKGGNVNFTGLTGSKDIIFKTAQNYRSSFDVDRHSGEIKDHNRSVILISPKGELLIKFAPDKITQMAKDIALHINDYNSNDIKPAKGCDLD